MLSKRNFSLNNRARGYSNYHGKRRGKKILLIIFLSLVIIFSVAYLLLQDNIVYDSDGNLHRRPTISQETSTSVAPLPPSDVTIEYLAPPDPYDFLPDLHAVRLADGELRHNTSSILESDGDALMISVKRFNGTLSYKSSLDLENIYMDPAPSRKNLETLLASDFYTIAQLSCFRDSSFIYVDTDAAILTSDANSFWFDEEGMAWLDPANLAVLNYTSALCQECLDMGFDEIVLDYFSYPNSGRLDEMNVAGDANRVEILTDFIQALRTQLPEGSIISILLRDEISDELGLSIDLLLNDFDRIYIAEGVDPSYLLSYLPANYNPLKRIVPLRKTPLASGSYVIVPETDTQ